MKIFVWGTGCPVSGLIGKYIAAENVEAFVDGGGTKTLFMGRPVITPAELAIREADLIVVANSHGTEIAEECKKLGIDDRKLFYMTPPKNAFMTPEWDTAAMSPEVLSRARLSPEENLLLRLPYGSLPGGRSPGSLPRRL